MMTMTMTVGDCDDDHDGDADGSAAVTYALRGERRERGGWNAFENEKPHFVEWWKKHQRKH